MNILQLSAKAQKFYEASRSKNLYSGYEKNVLVREDSENCLFVDATYLMEPGDVVFRCATINQQTKIDLRWARPEGVLKGKFTEREWWEMCEKMNGVLLSPEIDPREEVAGEVSEALAKKIRDLSKDEGECLVMVISDFWNKDKQFARFVRELL